MKYLIDTDAGTCVPYGGETVKTIADYMEQYIGAKEWDDVVEGIQKWFYGRSVHAAWCATGLSYFANMAGVQYYTGKYENVDTMKEHMNSLGMLDCTANYGGGHYKPKRGDVVFMSSKYTYKDCTHVGIVSEINHDTGRCLITSCNHNDGIGQERRNYITDKYIVAWGRVDY